MASPSVPWWISATWISSTLLTFMIIGAAPLGPVGNALLVTTICIIPPGVLLTLWNDGPPPTIAEVLHAAERGR